jgi:hypothetical protein
MGKDQRGDETHFVSRAALFRTISGPILQSGVRPLLSHGEAHIITPVRYIHVHLAIAAIAAAGTACDNNP